MVLFLYRLLKVWAVCTLVGCGAGLIFLAFRLDSQIWSAASFGIGVFTILSAVPLSPWLLVLPPFYYRPFWRVGV